MNDRQVTEVSILQRVWCNICPGNVKTACAADDKADSLLVHVYESLYSMRWCYQDHLFRRGDAGAGGPAEALG